MRPGHGWRRHALRVTAVLPIAWLAAVLAACSTAGAEQHSAPQFRVVIGDTTLTGQLFDNATARDLASALPMTLNFSDLHGLEKGAPLPRKLSVDGMPSGDDPQIGDLGYWAPSGNLVLYYGDVGYWTGILRIGHVDGDMRAVAAQSGDFDATVELIR